MEGGRQLKQEHFSSDEWQVFKQKTIEPEICAEMEVHLQFCESCQELYLNLIEQTDLELAQKAIPPDFTDSLLKKVAKQPTETIILKFPTKKSQPDRKNIFAYYVSAAILTLALMSGGVFDSMVDQSMRFTRICMLQTQNIEAKVSKDWSTELFYDGSQWMQKLSNGRERNVKDAKQE